jgi:hypothetical protein
MRRSTRILIAAAAALLIALPAGWYFGSPWWTLRRIDEAARAHDYATLASYVDFDAVWKASRADARRALRDALDRARDGKIGHLDASELIEVAKHEMRGGTDIIQETVDDIPFTVRDPITGPIRLSPYVEHRGLNEFLAYNRSTPSPATFVFRRHGFGWKLAEVRWGMPAE